MTTAELDRSYLDRVQLQYGGHASREQGVCAMELVAYLAGEPHSDSPECTCPVIASFLRSWNDDLRDDATRTRLLKPILPRVIGTRGSPDVENRRALLAYDWLIGTYAPAWLTLVKDLAPHADSLRALPEIIDEQTARASQPIAAAARAAAWAAARAAAGDAARAAARAAAGDAAWDAAGDAAGDAARAAAGAAAGAALVPTIEQLQVSAIDLLDRMIQVKD